jgi:hypothetical protein
VAGAAHPEGGPRRRWIATTLHDQPRGGKQKQLATTGPAALTGRAPPPAEHYPQHQERHVATTPVSQPSDDDPDQNDHGGQAGREVLAHLGFGPAFPGILLDPDPAEVEAAGTLYRVEQRFVVSLSTARWIGILREARYGSAQVKFFWHADPGGFPVLAIEDDPWDENPQDQPRLVYPDAQGRYALPDYWTALTDEQAADWTANHAAMLAELATTEPSPNVSTTITDFLQHGREYRDFDPDYHIRGIRRALDDYADGRLVDPIVDVITDPGADLGPEPESGIGVAVFLNGRPVPTDRHIILGAGTHATTADRDAIYDAIEQAEARLTPPAAALVRALLEPRVPAPTSCWPAFE